MEKAFPTQNRGRPPLLAFDDAYADILHVVRTGMQWRHLKPKHVSFITVFKAMHRWIDAKLFQKAYRALLRLYSRQRRPRYCCVDSSFVKNVYGTNCVGRNPTDRGRMGTKVTTIVDDQGMPFSLLFSPANHSDMRLLEPTLSVATESIPKGTPLYADRGYDSAHNRSVCRAHGCADRIFRRGTKTGRRTNAKRGTVERFFSWIDKQRRLIMRYERRVETYCEMTHLACGLLLERRTAPLSDCEPLERRIGMHRSASVDSTR